ncbi:hypothetical protein pdam_00024536 [Pocillopora damicornis]|uniref:F5/8 type C domain-containing protein n=1 Tax=Pocillopora damicornis TaxID=46731 RepID=A0A3M6TLK9_POCDA|nr:hypothetical protein pdam_00024536 [Pocillopora damicornis]
MALGGGCVASASNARLYFEDDQDRKQIRVCCASSRDLQWIKVDLERVNQITAVATQVVYHKSCNMIAVVRYKSFLSLVTLLTVYQGLDNE